MKRFVKSLIVASIAIFASGVAQAQLLWKVEKPGVEKPSYLLGTHHFAPVEILDSINGLEAAFQSVDKIYGEIDMALMNNPMEMMKYMDRLQAPADSTLDKILTPEELDSVNTVFTRFTNGAVPLSAMYPMKPSILTTQMMAFIMMERFPDKDMTQPGIDLLMQNRAKEAGKVVDGLETMEFQIDLLYGEPISVQKESLMEAVRDGGDSQIENTLKITDAYMARDLDTVEAMMTDPEIMTAEAANRMIFNRNRNWVEILKTEMTQHPIMVVVGAGHLPTDKGVIQGLRDAGYTVTPVD